MGEKSKELTKFYMDNRIHPLEFNCKNKDICKQYAYNKKMTDAKMSMVGSLYDSTYPKIVVLSLDPPLGEYSPFTDPEKRTTEYITKFHEKDDYSLNRPNVHWAMTQITVKDILSLWGLQTIANASIVKESYQGRPIQNVSSYFAHVNIAKCSMNNPGKRQANHRVHDLCSGYLKGELEILDPDILISQGSYTNKVVKNIFLTNKMMNDLPTAELIWVKDKHVLWLPMVHPAHHLKELREQWGFYIQEIEIWKNFKISSEYSNLDLQ
jgi:hypothetical protein